MLPDENLIERKNRSGTIYYENENGEIISKVCTNCNCVKVLDDYLKLKGGLGGRCAYCRTCKAGKDREKYHVKNREQKLEKNRIWRENNKEYMPAWYQANKESRLQYGREYREQNKESVLNYYERNKERYAEHMRKYRKENPDKERIVKQRRRARKSQLPDTLTLDEYENTLQYFGNSCALTGENVNLDKEHAIPISIGHGGTTFGNCYPMVSRLNQSKGSQNIFEWFEANRQRFNLSQERFDNLISWLASANAMTTDEYKDYVYWCHENPRAIDEKMAE